MLVNCESATLPS